MRCHSMWNQGMLREHQWRIQGGCGRAAAPPPSDPMPHVSEKGKGEEREGGKEREAKEEGNGK